MKTILIIDDEPDIRSTTGRILKKEGFEVLEARDGPEGLKVLENTIPDLILLDVMMPPPNGWDVCKLIKADAGLKGIPLVMFTVMTSDEDRDRSRECGADAHINKPFEKEELVKTVEDLLANIKIEI